MKRIISFNLLALSLMIGAGYRAKAQQTHIQQTRNQQAQIQQGRAQQAQIQQFQAPQNQTQQDSAENMQEAPYFIDGLHCEGIPSKESWGFSGEEEKARAEKRMSQAYCDGVFNMYGIRKFEWYTPDQIEYLQHALRKSEHFEIKDLALKKSSQPGHVHIYLKLQFNQEKHYSLDYFYEMHGDKKDSSGQAHGLKFDMQIPEAGRPFAWNINASHYEYKANQSLSPSLDWTPEQNELNQNPHTMINKIGFSFGHTIPVSPFRFVYDVDFISHNLNEKRRMGMDSGSTFNFLFSSAGERTVNSIGLLIDWDTASAFAQADKNNPTDNSRVGLVIDSELGERDRQFLKAKVKLLAPSKAEDSGLLTAQLRFGWEMNHYFEQAFINMDSVGGLRKEKNFNLGLQRRFAPTGRNSDIEFGLNKWFSVKEGRLRLSPFIGTSTHYYSVINPGKNSKDESANTSKTGLRLTWETAHFDISGSLTYFGERLQ